jgi:hypothetical protein
MRKATEAPRFPQSALLFQFSLRAMEHKNPGTNVHDQEIGNILSYNPSDTSHWKRGKKAVRSIYALEKLSSDLDADLGIIQDLAEGLIDLDEAWFDHLDAVEERRLTAMLQPEQMLERRIRQRMLENVAQTILSEARVEAVPVYLPELLEVLNFIQVTQGDVSDKLARSSKLKPGLYSIKHRKGDMRPHTRAAVAREMARIILFSERERFHIPERREGLGFFEILDLSNAFLVPQKALRAESQRVSTKVNFVRALSEVFWVPPTVVRSRLATLVLDSAPESVFSMDPMLIPARAGVSSSSPVDYSEDESSHSALSKG